MIKDADPTIPGIDVSADGKYIGLKLFPIIKYDDLYKFMVNGVEWKFNSMEYSIDDCTIFIHNPAATQKESTYSVEIIKSDVKKIYDVLGQQYDSVKATINNPVDTI